MTLRVAGHLRRRIRTIESEIGNLESRKKASEESISIADEELFAYKVEKQALQHALKSWSIEPEE